MLFTRVRISLLPSLALVWPSNWASVSLTEMTTVSPSRQSSPEIFVVVLQQLDLPPVGHSERWSGPGVKPSSCMPPSGVWTLLAKETMISLYPSLYCMATSAMESSRAPDI